MTLVPAEFETYDRRFADVHGDGFLRRLHDGCRWTEGPVYFPAHRTLWFSDIPNDQVLRYDDVTGRVDVMLQETGQHHNGHSRDLQGRLLSCEQGLRRVTRREHDGSLSVLADKVGDDRLNSPNDVTVGADGTVWFTDPTYGIDSDYEGERADPEVGGAHVYRVQPDGTGIEAVADDFAQPNGIAFSPDQSGLYVTDSMERHLRRFDVDDRGRLTGGAVIAECRAGTFDGMRFDAFGRLWISTQDGLDCYSQGGDLLGALRVPEVTSNLTFGGPRGNDLFITASTSLYSIRLNVRGAEFVRT